MTGAFGIWQHARGVTPDEAHGTCTDDVARALTVDLLHERTLGWEAVRPSARRSLSYLSAAYEESIGAFRNFRSASGEWMAAPASEDSQGRALLSLGVAVRDLPDPAMRGDARALMTDALPGTRKLSSPRAVASAILGCGAALDGGMTGEVELVFNALVTKLSVLFQNVDLDGDWPWPEESLTYENALLPRALIVAGQRLGDTRLRTVGLVVLDWLIEIQSSRRGMFTPVGNAGWWARGGPRAAFDQQPIEATSTILAAAAAYQSTQDTSYIRSAEAAYGWFLGDNNVGLVVADIATGGCHDGLAEDRVNLNQGAESTLMWLTALESMRALRTDAMAARQPRAHSGLTVLTEVHA